MLAAKRVVERGWCWSPETRPVGEWEGGWKDPHEWTLVAHFVAHTGRAMVVGVDSQEAKRQHFLQVRVLSTAGELRVRVVDWQSRLPIIFWVVFCERRWQCGCVLLVWSVYRAALRYVSVLHVVNVLSHGSMARGKVASLNLNPILLQYIVTSRLPVRYR